MGTRLADAGTPRLPAVVGYRQCTVVAGSARLDLSVSGMDTASSVIPQLLGMLRVRPPRTAGGMDGAPRWTLCRPGPVPVPADRPLGEVLTEGETLYLVPELHRFAPPRLSTGGGVFTGSSHFPSWTSADTRRTAAGVCAALAVVAAVLCAVAFAHGRVSLWPVVSVTSGLSGVAVLLARRGGGGGGVAVVLAVATLPLWVVTGWAAQRVWWPARALSPTLGISVLCAAALLGTTVIAATAASARARAVLVGLLGALLPVLLSTSAAAVSLPALGAGVAAPAITAVLQTLLVLLTPRIAVPVARLLTPATPQHVPAPQPDTEAPDCANMALTALLIGGGCSLIPAWWVLAGTGLATLPVLLVTVGLVLLQATAYRRRHQRVIALATGLAGISALGTSVLSSVPPPQLLAGVAALAALVALGTAGLINAPLPAAHPRAVRAAEMTEKLLLALLLPALFAALGLFSLMALLGAWWGG